MKKLFLLLTLLIGISTYSQNVTVVDTLDTTQAERIIDKYSNKIAESFNEGLNKVTPLAEEGWQIAIKLQIAKGISDLLFIPLSLLCIYLFFKSFKTANSLEEKNNDGFVLGVQTSICIVSAIVGIICIIASIFKTPLALQRLIAPEWFAIQEIIQLFN